MAKKVLNEAQLRAYVENEVRNALLEEGIDEGLLDSPFVRKALGGLLGGISIAPIITKLLESLGVPADSALTKLLVKAVCAYGGAKLSDWIYKKATDNDAKANVTAIRDKNNQTSNAGVSDANQNKGSNSSALSNLA